MLGKMLIHGLVAAALVGSAAAVYAQVKDNGYLAPQATETKREESTVRPADNGYLRPMTAQARRSDNERDRGYRSEHRRDRHNGDRDRGRDHDDDDD